MGILFYSLCFDYAIVKQIQKVKSQTHETGIVENRPSALHFSVQVLSESLKMIFFWTKITDFPRNLKNIVIHYFKISSALHISSIFLYFLISFLVKNKIKTQNLKNIVIHYFFTLIGPPPYRYVFSNFIVFQKTIKKTKMFYSYSWPSAPIGPPFPRGVIYIFFRRKTQNPKNIVIHYFFDLIGPHRPSIFQAQIKIFAYFFVYFHSKSQGTEKVQHIQVSIGPSVFSGISDKISSFCKILIT